MYLDTQVIQLAALSSSDSAVFAAERTWMEVILDAMLGLLQRNTVGPLEIIFLMLAGMAFGFLCMTFAYQAIVFTAVMAVGLAWGMVIGLLLERLSSNLALAY
jgi:hypothetical protein